MQYEPRRPYFAQRVGATITANCNDQAVIDSDLLMASLCGIEAFWYLMYPSEPNFLAPGKGTEDAVFTAGMNGGYKGYLVSPHRSKVKHAFIMEGYRTWSSPALAADWDSYSSVLAARMLEADYHQYNGRPILALFDAASFVAQTGGGVLATAQAAIASLRTKVQALGGQNPYIVSLDSTYTNLGFDAFSGYFTYSNQGQVAKTYADLTAVAVARWNALKASGSQIIPQITSGLDWTPRVGSGSPYVGGESVAGTAYAMPTTAQYLAHVQAAKTFIESFPGNCESGIGLHYAWNEFSEGGWICPSAADNYGDRIRGIAAMQGAPGLPSAQINMAFQSLLRAV
ncbi:hypothetical protein RD110_08070 [Rhodoferax koreense]|uniref:Uncharacterized protein n=1 Tax=Rhodoferax koreensis TaxID=1842727 RepID=A0A1P8JTS4_9BURK|nr:hypothetical protein RD110_08070 [Rhodoferax koreense]